MIRKILLTAAQPLQLDAGAQLKVKATSYFILPGAQTTCSGLNQTEKIKGIAQ